MHDSCHLVSLLESSAVGRNPVLHGKLLSKGRHRLTDRVKAGSRCAPLPCSPNQQRRPIQIPQIDHCISYIAASESSSGPVEPAPIVLETPQLCARQSNRSQAFLDRCYDLPMRMPVRNTSAPPRPTCRAAENTGVSMNLCRTHVMTPSSTRTTTIAIPKAS